MTSIGKRQGSDQADRVALGDDHSLRRAAFASLLSPWAASCGLTLDAANVGDHLAEAMAPTEGVPPVRMAILSLGGAPIGGELCRRWVAHWGEGTIKVLLSDEDRPERIIKAYELGTDSFLPTSMPANVGLKALTFVLKGGRFFPPGVLRSNPLPFRTATWCS